MVRKKSLLSKESNLDLKLSFNDVKNVKTLTFSQILEDKFGDTQRRIRDGIPEQDPAHIPSEPYAEVLTLRSFIFPLVAFVAKLRQHLTNVDVVFKW